MRKGQFPLIAGLPLAGMLLLTGCVDENYDLSDIDTTTEMKIDNLVLPINLKPVTLDKVIDVDDSDPDATIVKWPQGAPLGEQYYAVRKTGTFHSNPTSIDPVNAPVPEHINGIEQDVTGTPISFADNARKRVSGEFNAVKYNISKQHTEFKYKVTDVDPAIQSLEKTELNPDKLLTTTVTLTSPDVENSAEKVRFEGLILDLPLGMHGKCMLNGVEYSANEEEIDGTLHNALRLPVIEQTGHSASIELITDYIDFTRDTEAFGPNGIRIVNGAFDFSANIGVIKGNLIVFPNLSSSVSDLPTSMKFAVDYDMSEFTIDKFSGKIEYRADVDDIDPIDLTDLPDFLAGDETNLIIANPEISLQLSNPAAKYNIACKSGLKIIPVRDDIDGTVCELPGDFVVGYDKGDGPYSFILAPHPDKAANPNGYQNPELLTYPTLGNILAGTGLPDQLKIELSNDHTAEPTVYGDAQNFELNKPIDSVDGSYCFFTPLALADGSTIVYDTTVDWNSDEDDENSDYGNGYYGNGYYDDGYYDDGYYDDGYNENSNDEDSDFYEDLHLELIGVSAIADTDLPCEVKLTMRPLDKYGNTIEIDNPELSTITIPAHAQNSPFELQLKGKPDITDFSGLHIIAHAKFDNSDAALNPNQNIKLSNIKIRVSGRYVTDF